MKLAEKFSPDLDPENEHWKKGFHLINQLDKVNDILKRSNNINVDNIIWHPIQMAAMQIM